MTLLSDKDGTGAKLYNDLPSKLIAVKMQKILGKTCLISKNICFFDYIARLVGNVNIVVNILLLFFFKHDNK